MSFGELDKKRSQRIRAPKVPPLSFKCGFLEVLFPGQFVYLTKVAALAVLICCFSYSAVARDLDSAATFEMEAKSALYRAPFFDKKIADASGLRIRHSNKIWKWVNPIYVSFEFSSNDMDADWLEGVLTVLSQQTKLHIEHVPPGDDRINVRIIRSEDSENPPSVCTNTSSFSSVNVGELSDGKIEFHTGDEIQKTKACVLSALLATLGVQVRPNIRGEDEVGGDTVRFFDRVALRLIYSRHVNPGMSADVFRELVDNAMSRPMLKNLIRSIAP